MALKKYCARYGCNKLINATETYCETHARTNAERNAEYDKTQRDKRAKAFYNSAEWKRTRAVVLARDSGIDVYAYMIEHRVVPATVVHHIEELREDYSKRCALSNLISVSEATHEGAIKQAYGRPDTKRAMQRVLRESVKNFKKIRQGVL